METPAPPLDLLTAKQAAAQLSIPLRTFHRWILAGKVEATKIGDGRTSAYVITRAEVERLGEAS